MSASRQRPHLLASIFSLLLMATPAATANSNTAPAHNQILQPTAKLLQEGDEASKQHQFSKALQLYQFAARQTHDKRNIDSALALSKLAQLQLMLNHPDMALEAASAAIKTAPNCAAAQKVLARIKLDQGELESAKLALLNCAKLNAADAEIYSYLADIYERQGDQKSALGALRKVLALDPGNEYARMCIAENLTQQGQRSDAIKLCQEGLSLNRQSSKLLLQLGLLYIKAGNYRQAAEYCKQARNIDPHEAQPFELLTTISGAQQDWGSAIDYAHSFAQVDPDNPNAKQYSAWADYAGNELSDARAGFCALTSDCAGNSDLHNLYALILIDSLKFKEAGKELSNALVLDKDNLSADANQALLWSLLGEQAKALAAAAKLTEKYPDAAAINALSAYIHLGAGQVAQARLLALEALQADSQNALALVTLAGIAVHERKFTQALEQLQRINPAEANCAWISCQWGQIYLAAGDFPQAAHYAQMSLQFAPSNLNAKTLLALSLAGQQNWDGALLYLKELSVRTPKNLLVRLALADALIHKGDEEAAITALNAAHKAVPDSAAPLIKLGQLAQQQGHHRQCRSFAQQALHLDGNNKEAQALLQNCRRRQAINERP